MREFYELLLSKSFYKYIAEGRSTRFIGLKMRHLPAGMRGFWGMLAFTAKAKWLSAHIVFFLLAGLIFPGLAPASDLAAGCCADLESRIAELEATAARKGNRAVSLQIYGQVNRALMIWDDGFASDAYVVDNATSSTRLGLVGRSPIEAGWHTGYRIEVEFDDAPSDEVFNGPDGDDGIGTEEVRIRHSYLFVENARLGRLSLGQQSQATDNITIINLGARMSDAALHYNNNFGLRLDLEYGLTTDLTWGQFAHTVDSYRGDFLRYDTPAIHGFVLSSAVGEDDIWDVALRYSGDWNSIRVAAGAGYMNDGELDFEDVRGSLSAIHQPSGVFLSAAGGIRHDHSGAIGDGENANFYFAQLGLQRRFLPYGATSLYGEFGIYNDFTVGTLLQADLGDDGNLVTWGRIADSQVQRLGAGVEQAFDASALLLYAQYHYYDAELLGNTCEYDAVYACTGFYDEAESLPVERWSAVVLGGRIQF
jgi:hypothetical protein